MRIVFLAIGDELLRGESREGNGAALAELLAERRLKLAQMRVLPDDFTAIADGLRGLLTEPSLVIVSGGLGPTDDDFTRAAVARAFGVDVERDPAVVEQIRARFTALGRTMHPANERQADRPAGAAWLPNAFGSAPGFVLDVPGGHVASFPGVPSEFRGMLGVHLDALLARAGVHVVRKREVTWRLFGIPESDLQGLLQPLPGYTQIGFRSLPKYPEIRLKFAEKDDPAALDTFLAAAREAVGWRLWGEGDADTHPAAVVRALAAKGLTVAAAESCTGGLIGHLLTEVPGASRVFLGDVVAYANPVKVALLGVPQDVLDAHGAVSEPTACAMAEGVRARTGADVGIATTGIAGPDGGTEDKPVGTVCIAIAAAGGTRVRTLRFPGMPRSRWKLLVAHTALEEIRRWAMRDV